MAASSAGDRGDPVPYVRILWNTGTIAEWDRLYRLVPFPTLPQCFAYAESLALCERVRPRFGLIEADEQPVGIVLIHERRSLGVLSKAELYRGPLWLGEPQSGWWPCVLTRIRQAYPGGFGRWLRFLPEAADKGDGAIQARMTGAGFRQVGTGYRTIRLDLRPTLEQLRASLAANWRSHLKVGERQGLTIEVDREAKSLPWLLERYQAHKRALGYNGPSPALAVRLRNRLRHSDGAFLLRAFAGETEPVAAILLLSHGNAATYLIGWSGPLGRRLQAHTVLLWRGVETLKSIGIGWFDLGGLHPIAAPGVTAFKRGLGGEELVLPATWG